MEHPSAFLKRLVKRVCVNVKKQELAERARTELRSQLIKVKQTSKLSPKRWLIEKEIKTLEKKIDEVLKREIELLSMNKAGNLEIRQISKNIVSGDKPKQFTQLEQDKVEQIISMLSEIKNKLEMFLEDNEAMKKKKAEIDYDARKRAFVRINAIKLERKLREVENRYKRVREQNSEDYRAEEIENRLNLLKERIAEIG
ncbi:MAG: hypothetical protein AABY14_04040 [Nanoarchaeota archaeon]